MSRAITSLLGLLLAGAVPTLAQTAAMPNAAVPADSPVNVAEMAPNLDLTAPAIQPSGFYADASFLLFWFKPICLNVPVISISRPGTAVPGAVNQPGTQVLVGGSPPHKFEFAATPGIQTKLGWLNSDGSFGMEVSGFVTATASAQQAFLAAPNGSPASYLPYQATDNSQQALPFTIPGVVTGSSVAVGSTRVWGVESNVFLPATVDRDGYSLYGALLLGARYLDLTDRDHITNTLALVSNPAAVAVGADQVTTHNQFAGPQVGAAMGLTWGRWSLLYTTKLAAGLTNQVRTYQGAPIMAATELSPLLVPGPLIVLPSNIGRGSARRVTLVPEIGLQSRLALTSWCWLTLGYRLIYWNKVLCPGDQMDPTVNVTQLPFHGPVTGTLAPAPLFVHTDYFAQGIDLGLQFRF